MPWVKQNLGTTGNEQTWLIGFSKSGHRGARSHPEASRRVHAGGFLGLPGGYVGIRSVSAVAAGFGTDANFQANYRLTQSFVDAHKAPFVSNNRIWIGGYQSFQDRRF